MGLYHLLTPVAKSLHCVGIPRIGGGFTQVPGRRAARREVEEFFPRGGIAPPAGRRLGDGSQVGLKPDAPLFPQFLVRYCGPEPLLRWQ